jgi:hypothetical protein
MSEIGKQMIGLGRDEFVVMMPAGCDNDGPGADGPGTLHIKRSVADDPDVGWIDPPPNVCFGFGKGSACHVISIRQAIGKAAEREVLPQAEVAELDLGPAANVAREQADNRTCAFAAQGFLNSWKNGPVQPFQGVRQARQVGGMKRIDVRIGRLDVVKRKQFAAYGGIGAAAIRDLIADFFDSEGKAQPGLHRGLAGATGADEGSIDVEQEHAHLANIGLRQGPRDGDCFMSLARWER